MKRALLVIDVQNEYFEGGQLPVTHPRDHLGQMLRAMDAATDAGVPVVVVQHSFPQPEMPFFKRGTPGWELHPEVASRPREHWVEKNLPGSFTGTGLEAWLRGREIGAVTVAGYMTHMCCDTTARQAAHRGLKVEFLSDATGTLAVKNSAGEVGAEELHRATLCAQQMMIAEVLETEQWMARL